MTFIQPDEFIILIDNPGMTLDDLKRIHDTGIDTIFNAMFWSDIERKPGEYNWETTDAMLERAKSAGMKTLFRCHDNAPTFFPDGWYLQSANGAIWKNHYGFGGNDKYTDLTPWNYKAMKAEHDFMKLCNERYNDEWVQCFAGGPHGGEVILPGMIPCYCDDHALESFKEFTGENKPADLQSYQSMKFETKTVKWLKHSLRNHVKEKQNIFPEIWLQLVERNTPFAESFECGPRSGNWLMSELCDRLPKELNKDLNVLLWEVNRPGGDQGALNNVKDVLDKVWIGSQYCEGLYKFTPDAIKQGLRGFVTCPTHFMRGGGEFESWMLDAFRWSIAQWKAARL